MSESTTVVNIKHGRRGSVVAYDVYIGRPGPWGNPFVVGVDGTRDAVIMRFKRQLLRRLSTESDLAQKLESLRGKRLGCYCAPLPCHGDVLIELLGTDERADTLGTHDLAGDLERDLGDGGMGSGNWLEREMYPDVS